MIGVDIILCQRLFYSPITGVIVIILLVAVPLKKAKEFKMGVLKNKLVEFGLSETDAEKFIAENITNKMLPKSDLDAKIDEAKDLAEQVKSLNKTITERDDQLEQLKTGATNAAEYQKQIEELQEANKLAAKEHETAMLVLKKDNLLTQALTKEGAKNVELVKHAFKEYMESAKIDESGNLVGLGEKVKEIKANESYSFCFEAQQQANLLEQAGLVSSQPGQGLSPTDPASIDPTKPMSYADFEKAYMAQNNPNTG